MNIRLYPQLRIKKISGREGRRSTKYGHEHRNKREEENGNVQLYWLELFYHLQPLTSK